MSGNLTAKQEGFCLSVAKGLSLAQAYRDNYNAENMANETIWVKASELMSNGKVAVRVSGLQGKAQERTLVTMESITAELDENRMMGAKLDQPAAMNAASMGKAKLHGLLVDKTDNKHEHGISEGMADLLKYVTENTKRVGE